MAQRVFVQAPPFPPAYGRAATIDQSGWHLEYTEYQPAQRYELPRKFEAVLNDDVSLKVVVDDWSGLP